MLPDFFLLPHLLLTRHRCHLLQMGTVPRILVVDVQRFQLLFFFLLFLQEGSHFFCCFFFGFLFVFVLDVDPFPVYELVSPGARVGEGVAGVRGQGVRHQNFAQKEVSVHGFGGDGCHFGVLELHEGVPFGPGGLLGTGDLDSKNTPILGKILLELVFIEPMGQMANIHDSFLHNKSRTVGQVDFFLGSGSSIFSSRLYLVFLLTLTSSCDCYYFFPILLNQEKE